MKNFYINAEISKAVKDDRGDWIIEGIASTGKRDYENEKVDPKGLDLSYFINKGFIKYEHGKSPKQFIGEPIEAKIVPEGFYLKGRLYRHSPMAQEAVEALETLEKSGAKRKLHWSIEAATLSRDPADQSSVTKAILRNVVLTFNPVNDDTWAKLCKSMNKIEWAVDSEYDAEKSLSTDSASGQVIMPESLEGGLKTKAPVEAENSKIKKAFAKYLKFMLKKAVRKHLNKSLECSPSIADEISAFKTATERLSPKEAEKLASYILEKSLASSVTSIAKKLVGGEGEMSKADNKVVSELDEALDLLNKSLGIDSDEPEDDLDNVEDNLEGEGEEGEEFDDDMVDGEDGEDGEDGDAIEKSFMESLLAKDDDIEKALEVSEFLDTLTNAIGESMDGFSTILQKSLNKTSETQQAMATVLGSTGNLIKSLTDTLTKQEALLTSMQAEMSEFMGRPVGRKSVVNSREIDTLKKSLDQPKPKTKAQVVDLLVKSFEAKEYGVTPMDVTAFETSGYIRPEVRESLGL